MGPARIKFGTSGSAVELATDCATGPGKFTMTWFSGSSSDAHLCMYFYMSVKGYYSDLNLDCLFSSWPPVSYDTLNSRD